jgi:hypothetical protein
MLTVDGAGAAEVISANACVVLEGRYLARDETSDGMFRRVKHTVAERSRPLRSLNQSGLGRCLLPSDEQPGSPAELADSDSDAWFPPD